MFSEIRLQDFKHHFSYIQFYFVFWFALILTSWHCTTSLPAQFYSGRFDNYKCLDPQSGRELFIGDAFTRHGRCIRVQCLGSLQIWEDTCQIPQLNGDCTRVPAANEFLDYPKCCPMYECKTYKTNENGETEEKRLYDHYGNLRKQHITQVFVVSDPGTGTGQVPGSGVMTQFEI